MNHKNGRWAIPLTIVILTILLSNESASARLPYYSSQKALVITQDSTMPDHALPQLDLQNDLVRPLDESPKEGGVYVADSVAKHPLDSFLYFISHLPYFKSVFHSEKKILIMGPTIDDAATFLSTNSGKKYLLSVRPFINAMTAEGYFAEMDDYGVISVQNVVDKTKYFVTLFHEMVHSVQFNKGMKPGQIYNLATDNIKSFSNERLKQALGWVQSEIESHRVTAQYIDGILSLNEDGKGLVKKNLGLDFQKLQQEKDAELAKYSGYEIEELKIVDELIARKIISHASNG
jgi:hypothetical protein